MLLCVDWIWQGAEVNCALKKSEHSVYFLESLTGRKTYVGYSVDPFRRLRQHNGEIVGGAKRTKKGGPWKIKCIVGGFPTERSALQFEWKWHRLRRKIKKCEDGLSYLFNTQWTKTSPEPFSFPLTLIWLNGPNLTEWAWFEPIKYNCWVVYPAILR